MLEVMKFLLEKKHEKRILSTSNYFSFRQIHQMFNTAQSMIPTIDECNREVT